MDSYLLSQIIISAEKRLTKIIENPSQKGYNSFMIYAIDHGKDTAKTFFMNAKSENLDSDLFLEIGNQIFRISNRIEKLSELIDCGAYHPEYNKNVRAFYRVLLNFLKYLNEYRHDAFKDHEKYLERLEITEPSQNMVTNKNVANLNRIKFRASREKLLNGFSELQKQGLVKIYNIHGFIGACFSCDYDNIIDYNPYFEFEWTTATHALSQLLADLKRKRKITCTVKDIADFVTALVPKCKSSDSVRKYVEKSSNPEERLSLKGIDYKLFT